MYETGRSQVKKTRISLNRLNIYIVEMSKDMQTYSTWHLVNYTRNSNIFFTRNLGNIIDQPNDLILSFSFS